MPKCAFMLGVWSLAHGMATLVVDGKLVISDNESTADVVAQIVSTMLETNITL